MKNNFRRLISLGYIIFVLIIVIGFKTYSQDKKNSTHKKVKPENNLPKIDDIKNDLYRILAHFKNNTSYKIINVKTGKEITDFSKVLPEAGNDIRNGAFTDWSYTMGVVYSGMNLASEVTGDKSFFDYAVKNYNFIFDHLNYFRKQAAQYGPKSYGYGKMIHMTSLDHCGSIGGALIKIYYKDMEPRFKAEIDSVADYISIKQFRLKDGTLGRTRPQPVSLWTDDFYMCVTFLAQMGKLTGNKKYYDDAVKQVLQLSERLFIPQKGLFDHGWNANVKYDPKYYWSRANGWAMMAMTELLDVLPENYKDRDKITDILQRQVEAVAECQDKSGLWHNLLDKSDSFLETSGTAMFIYSIAHGINKGWINHTYGPVVITAWKALAKYIRQDGQIEKICEGSTFTNDITYYYNRPTSLNALHGYGPTILAASEMIKLLRNNKFEIQSSKNTFHFILNKNK